MSRPEILSQIAAWCRHYGIFLIADEVMTGFGRTGTMFASQLWSAPPDILLTSKGLTNGTCAASALLVSPAVYGAFEAHNAMLVHAETQAGTPPSCAAIVATLQQFDHLHALANGRRVAGLLDQGLRDLAERNEMVHEVSGSGCFRGLQLRAANGTPFWSHHVTRLIDAIRAHGALVHPGPSAIQLVPPLTLSDGEVSDLLQAVEAGLEEFATSRQRPRASVSRA
jgi:adenosylmethionine-8-amino-7-oxononanoate aminotransferase